MTKNREVKYVIICTNNKNFFEILMCNLGFEVLSLYKNNSLIARNIRKVWFRYKFPFPQIWFNKDVLNYYDETYILFDSLVNKDYLEWLKQKRKKNRIIFWYWNPVRKSLGVELVKRNGYEGWSYSLEDCYKYRLKYNTQFYFGSLKLQNTELLYDVFFLGKDKGRLTKLLELKDIFEQLGLKVNFHIVANKRELIGKEPYYKKVLSYEAALIEIARSKTILDILSDPQDGLTMRAMESIFHEKKLITNSQIICDYDFYDAQNIFLLGRDNLNNLPSFINTPYKKIHKRIVEKYNFVNWIERF